MYVETGTAAYEDGRYATAETMFLAARTEAEGFGSNDVRLASTLLWLARVYNAKWKHEKAEQDCRLAIQIWDSASASASIEFADDLKELLTKVAGELRRRKKYGEAELLYKRAQDIAEKHFGPEDPHVAEALTAQADNFYDEEKYAQAEALYVRALAITEKKQSSEDRDVVKAIRPLALTLFAQKKFDQARPLVEQAIKILEKNNQPEAASTFLDNLAGELRDRKNYEEAEPLYKRAQDIAEKHFGPNDPHVAKALTARAHNFYNEEKYAEAEPLYAKALAITEKKQDSKDADVVKAIRPLALTLFAQEKFDQGDLRIAQAMAISGKNNQPEAALTFVNDLAYELQRQKKYDAAEPLYKRAQDIAEKHFGSDDPQVAKALTAQADNFSAEEKYDSAEPLYRRALAITEKKQGSENPEVVDSIRDLVVALFEENKFSQARQLAERAIAILEKNNQRDNLAAPLTFLGRTCEKLHSYADAERAYKRALDTLGHDNRGALDTLENYSRMLRDLKREKEAEALEAHIRKIQASTGTVEKRR